MITSSFLCISLTFLSLTTTISSLNTNSTENGNLSQKFVLDALETTINGQEYKSTIYVDSQHNTLKQVYEPEENLHNISQQSIIYTDFAKNKRWILQKLPNTVLCLQENLSQQETFLDQILLNLKLNNQKFELFNEQEEEGNRNSFSLKSMRFNLQNSTFDHKEILDNLNLENLECHDVSDDSDGDGEQGKNQILQGNCDADTDTDTSQIEKKHSQRIMKRNLGGLIGQIKEGGQNIGKVIHDGFISTKKSVINYAKKTIRGFQKTKNILTRVKNKFSKLKNSFVNYGRWCGPGKGGFRSKKCQKICKEKSFKECKKCYPPIDSTDEACMKHDFCAFNRVGAHNSCRKAPVQKYSCRCSERFMSDSSKAIVLCKTKKCIKTARKHIIAFRTLHCGCVYKACIKYPAIQRGKFKIKRRCKTFKSCIPYTMCKLLKGN